MIIEPLGSELYIDEDGYLRSRMEIGYVWGIWRDMMTHGAPLRCRMGSTPSNPPTEE